MTHDCTQILHLLLKPHFTVEINECRILEQLIHTVLFIFLSPPRFFSGNQGNHQNSKKILVFHKLWLIWIRKKQKKIKMADSKKLSFSTTPKSWAIVAKISRIGPWVSRIDWREGHWYDSSYIVVRRSDLSTKTA